ncbi:MAG: hypothetical protein R3B09_21530 [Nannocystaceae bacterium]
MHRALLLALVIAGLGCGPGTPAPTPSPVASAPAPEEPAKVEAPPKKPAEPLTQEELDLIAADPGTLTPAERRQRAFALRKKIMQDPDSKAAKSLERVRQQIESGEIKPELPNRSVTFSARTPEAPPADGAKDEAATSSSTPPSAPSAPSAPPAGSR